MIVRRNMFFFYLNEFLFLCHEDSLCGNDELKTKNLSGTTSFNHMQQGSSSNENQRRKQTFLEKFQGQNLF